MRFGIVILLLAGCASFLIPKTVQGIEPQHEMDQAVFDSARVKLMVERADSLSQRGNLSEATLLLEQARLKADSLDIAFLINMVQISRAENYLRKDQPDSTKKILEPMLPESTDENQKARILALLGSASRYKGNYDDALEKQELAKALIDSVSTPGLYGQINLNIASIFEGKGNFGSAFKYYLSGIKAVEAAGDSLALSTALNNIGVAYNNYNQPEKAQYYLRRSIKLNEKLNNRLGLLRATNNLAISTNRLGDYDEAIALYDRSLKLHQEIRKEVPPFRILYNLGQLYKDKGDLDKAENYYQQSLAYCKTAGIPQGLIYNYGGLADVAELKKDYTKARDYYNRALTITRNIGAGSLEKSALQSLYNLEKGLDNTGEALHYYEQYVALDDSLDAIARKQESENSQATLNLHQQEEINRLLQEKQQQQEAKIRAQNWLIALGIAIMLVILLSLFLLYRSNAEKKKINKKLEFQRNQLEELNKVKDKMLAIIAHDLRSPLAAMHGMLYLMQEEELSESEIKQMTAELNVSLSRNINMMDNLLAWAEGQMNGFSIHPEAVYIRKVMEEVLDSCRLQARQKGIIFTNHVDASLQVKADYDLLKLVIRNLISNSIKFCHQNDTIMLSARDEKDAILIEIKDSGIGMSAELQRLIFSNDVQSRAGTNNEKGSGLGLSLCKEFVEKQHGTIHVASSEGKGTTIQFSLPAV